MLNKMLKVNDVKIGLARKISIVLLVGALLVLAGAYFFLQKNQTDVYADTVALGRKQFTIELADTEAKRTQGLSDRADLHKNSVMLFAFPSSGKECMWMKDMKFSLDMVWLNQDKKITKIAENISPDTYPQAFCGDGAKYVLELNAGVASANGLKIGQNLNF